MTRTSIKDQLLTLGFTEPPCAHQQSYPAPAPPAPPIYPRTPSVPHPDQEGLQAFRDALSLDLVLIALGVPVKDRVVVYTAFGGYPAEVVVNHGKDSRTRRTCRRGLLKWVDTDDINNMLALLEEVT